MLRRDAVFSAPPPPYPVLQQNNLPHVLDSGNTGNHNNADVTSSSSSSSTGTDNLSPSIIITVLVLATAIIVSASLYLLLRFMNRHCRRSSPAEDVFDPVHHHHRRHHMHNNNNNNHRNQHNSNSSRVVPEEKSSFINSLPLFTFASITNGRNTTNSGDCAVCLSKFEPHDQLRLLPICCHAFHADCIDTWLATNQTCPLCRSSIFTSESDVMSKLLRTTSATMSSGYRSGSFRVEIGNVSRRRLPSDSSGEQQNRSYSIGSFDYIVDDLLSEVTVASSTRRASDYNGNGAEKNDEGGQTTEAGGGRMTDMPGQNFTAEMAGGGTVGRSWLRDYVDRLGWTASFSLSSSLRSSGRFFTGSSRRTTTEGIRDSDLEASRLGDEIGEMFRWLSGV